MTKLTKLIIVNKIKHMKQTLLFKPHSIVDIITNSSSELFICNTDKSKEVIEEYLREMIKFNNLENKYQTTYEHSFGDIMVVDESNVDEIIDEYVIGWGFHSYKWNDVDNPPDLYELHSEHAPYKFPYDQNREYNEKIRDTIHKKEEKTKANWLAKNGEKVKKQLIGNILIFSQSDNSIPFELFEIIENRLNAERIHLG